MKRASIFFGFVAALLCLASVAEAQTRVVVLDFRGPRSAAVRNQAVRGLSGEGDLEFVPSAQAGSPRSDADFASVASDLGVSVFIGGRVRRRGRRFSVTIVARDGTGAEIHRERYRRRGAGALGRAVRRKIWDDFRDAIQSAPAPEGGGGGGGPDEGVDDAGGGGDDAPLGPAVVLPFDGPGAGRARSRVVSALEDAAIELVPKNEAEGRGDPEEARGRLAIARHLGVTALISGEVQREGRSYSATVVVYDGRDGEEIDAAEFEGRTANALLSSIESSLWDEIGDYVAEGGLPRDDDDDDDDDDGGWSGPDGPLPSPLTLIAEFAGFGREYSYNDDIFGALRAYSLNFAPMVGAKLYYFPAAHFTNGFAANIGLDARIETAFGVKSQDSMGQEFPTSMWGFGLHGRVRIPIDTHHITGVVGYGMQSFRIEAISPTIPAPDVPDVDYGYLRMGVELRLVFGAFVTELKASLLPLLSSGQLGSEEWFPRTTGGGMEAGLVLGVMITDWFEARAGFEYRRFWFSMNPEPGDTYVAGGAVDNYFVGNFGLALHWLGSD